MSNGSVKLAGDPDCRLLVSADDCPWPEVTILIPAVNEELTSPRTSFAWCHEGLREAGAVGEILIVDSSTDRTAELALAGARVSQRRPSGGSAGPTSTPFPYIRGKYVAHGRRRLHVRLPQAGAVRRAASRRQRVRHGLALEGLDRARVDAALHRYFGTPVTTWILNRLYGSHFTDIHCGMRGITRDALERMGLASQSWEYASEMVLKSVRMELRTDRGTGHLLQGPRGGCASQALGLVLAVPGGVDQPPRHVRLRRRVLPVQARHRAARSRPAPHAAAELRADHDRAVTFSLYWMLLGVDAVRRRAAELLLRLPRPGPLRLHGPSASSAGGACSATRATVVVSVGAVRASASVSVVALVVQYVTPRLRAAASRVGAGPPGVIGLLLMIIGFSTFCFTLLLHATDPLRRRRSMSRLTERRPRERTSRSARTARLTPVDRFGVWLSSRADPQAVGTLRRARTSATSAAGSRRRFMRSVLPDVVVGARSSTSRSPTTSSRSPRSRRSRARCPTRCRRRRRVARRRPVHLGARAPVGARTRRWREFRRVARRAASRSSTCRPGWASGPWSSPPSASG